MKFIIGGTGRSGTKWCATVLRVAGYACGHEQVYTTDTLGKIVAGAPLVVADCDIRAEGFDGDASLASVPLWRFIDGVRKVLVVRHPLTFAGSLLRVGPLLARSQPAGLHAWLDRFHPDVADASSEVDAAIRYWTVWNTEGLTHAHVTIPLEHLTPDGLLKACRVDPVWPMFPVDPINVGPPGDLDPTWDDIDPPLAAAAQTLANKLGYQCGTGAPP